MPIYFLFPLQNTQQRNKKQLIVSHFRQFQLF